MLSAREYSSGGDLFQHERNTDGMDLQVRKPVNCTIFAHWLVHFQADELPEADRAALQEHIDVCAGCQRRLEVEDRFLDVLRERMPRVPAPPGLETRVRAALEEAGARAAREASIPIDIMLFAYPINTSGTSMSARTRRTSSST